MWFSGCLFLPWVVQNVDFLKIELWWRSYTIEEALSTIKQVELVGKKEFAAAALDPGHETFVVHEASLESPSSTQKGDVHPFCRVQIAALVVNEAPNSISIKYSDFEDVFFLELVSEFSENTGINDYAIELVDDWQPPYGPIYSLELVELKTLKTYIETNLTNGFIRPSKSPARAPIFLIKSQIAASNFVLIIKDLTTPQSRTNIHYLWLGSL